MFYIFKELNMLQFQIGADFDAKYAVMFVSSNH